MMAEAVGLTDAAVTEAAEATEPAVVKLHPNHGKPCLKCEKPLVTGRIRCPQGKTCAENQCRLYGESLGLVKKRKAHEELIESLNQQFDLSEAALTKALAVAQPRIRMLKGIKLDLAASTIQSKEEL